MQALSAPLRLTKKVDGAFPALGRSAGSSPPEGAPNAVAQWRGGCFTKAQ